MSAGRPILDLSGIRAALAIPAARVLRGNGLVYTAGHMACCAHLGYRRPQGRVTGREAN